MKLHSSPAVSLRNAASPFTIPLGRDNYYLTREALDKAIDSSLTRKKGWYSPVLKFISFKKGKLVLKMVFIDKVYELTVDIEKDRLQVACSCGEQVETLCIHAFKTLDRLCWYEGTDYFQQFRPGGLFEISVKHKKYFTARKNYYGRNIQPRENLGPVYSLSDIPALEETSKILSLPPGKTVKPAGESDVVCYMVVGIQRKDHPPLVMPCMGKLNKAATAVKTFYPFLTGIQKEYEPLLTPDQKLLNEHCLALFKEAEQLPGRFFPRYEEPVDISRYDAYFHILKKLWPLLQKQTSVFKCTVGNKRELKKKPPLTRSRPVTLPPYHHRLSFRLVDKGPFFQLEMTGNVDNKPVRRFELPMPFFMEDEKNNLFLLSSTHDAWIAEWMYRFGNRITVFKEHFSEFETNFLSRLQAHYEVIRIKQTTKRKTSSK